MRLRSLAGAYAGQVQEYGSTTGLAALRSGMAERIDRSTPAPQPRPVAIVTTTPVGKRKSKK